MQSAMLEFTHNQRLALYTLIGLSAIGISLTHVRNSFDSGSGEVTIREPASDGRSRVVMSGSDAMPNSYANRNAGKVVFHIAGCVKKPGVYSLPEGDRVIDAITYAGGVGADADLNALNLADKIEDGAKIDVPSKSESAVRLSSTSAPSRRAVRVGYVGSSSGAAAGKFTMPGQGVVHLNSASAEELRRLPGVGPVTAEKILAYRKQIGRFTATEQLMDVKGIGPKKFEKMRPFVAL